MPAALSNTTPVIAAQIPVLKNLTAPMDFGLSFRGKRILGANKTIRGLLIGVATSILVAALQRYVFQNSPFIQGNMTITGYGNINILLFGIMSGLGGILGDAGKSFFKRQKGIAPGTSWFPFDQIDYVIGGLIFVYPLVRPSFIHIVMIIAIYSLLHPPTTYIGFYLKLKDSPI